MNDIVAKVGTLTFTLLNSNGDTKVYTRPFTITDYVLPSLSNDLLDSNYQIGDYRDSVEATVVPGDNAIASMTLTINPSSLQDYTSTPDINIAFNQALPSG